MGFEWIAIIMFVLFFVMILYGYPVAFSFAGTAIVFGLIGLLLGAFDLNLLRLLPNRWFGTMSDLTLLAIIFFVFMGAVFEKSGLAEDLLETLGILMGPMPGGLALAVVIVGTLLAAATGVVAATVIVMGLISLPVMVRYGYDHKLATGAITSSGTLAQLIPPSLVLVVLSDQIGVSVGDLFVGALIPGLILAGLYAGYVMAVAFINPAAAPPLPPEARTLKGAALFRRTLVAVFPPLFLIFAVLGSIFFGLAAPFEAGAVGAFGACILTALNGNLTWKIIRDAARSTANITALVIMILFCSTLFGLVFDGLGGQSSVKSLLVSLPGGYWGFVIIANIVIFLLGINLEFIEISFIAMPLFVPAARELNIDLVWFGVMMAINLNMAFISPPVGFSLFYLQSVAPPEVETIDIHKGALPFMALQAVALIIVIVFPETVTWLVQFAS
ncbi:MAG: TRAP transporter large permease subunit [Caldilineaceae bacterium]